MSRLALSIGAVPFTLVQALGKPKWSATVHVIELPIHAAVTWWAVSTFGVVGAAAAWSLRALYDAALFDAGINRLIGRRTDATRDGPLRLTAVMVAGAAILSTLAAFVPVSPIPLAIAGGVSLLAFAAVAWAGGLEAGERAAIRSALRRLSPRSGASVPRESIPEPMRDQAGRL